VQAIRVQDIDLGGFEAFGEVLPRASAAGRADLVAEWTAFARERYGTDVVARELAIPAKPPLLDFVEAHPNSPQLTVSFGEPWLLSVLPQWAGLETFDPAAVQSFVVPPGTAVLIPAGLWHGSVTPLESTDVLVIFRADVVDEWTELSQPVPLVIDRGTV
jgi:ureidoglycolate lyase